MLIRTPSPSHPKEGDVTPESVYLNRRTILKGLGLGVTAMALPISALAETSSTPSNKSGGKNLDVKKTNIGKDLSLTPESKATTYNNFYEFGTEKSDPAKNSKHFKSEPWTLKIEGLVEKPQVIDVWEMINKRSFEERIYRMRCVEAWSMVIPWLGLELSELLRLAVPKSNAKYVLFETLLDPKQFPNQGSSNRALDYPYVEGLRLDEAMNPLSFLAVGIYGKVLPAQNGAPIRLVVPWKYGFKSIKSIVSIKLVEEMPRTTWNRLASDEYGFYANVNPAVDHPRWSQASERFIGATQFFGSTRQKTLLFNGYQEEVSSLYASMDLRKWF